MNANCPKTDVEKIIYEVYNSQRDDMMIPLSRLAVTDEVRNELHENFLSKGFVSIVYIRACIMAATPIRDVEDTSPTKKPNWRYYAQFIPGSSLD